MRSVLQVGVRRPVDDLFSENGVIDACRHIGARRSTVRVELGMVASRLGFEHFRRYIADNPCQACLAQGELK